jgi:hypothetical protein
MTDCTRAKHTSDQHIAQFPRKALQVLSSEINPSQIAPNCVSFALSLLRFLSKSFSQTKDTEAQNLLRTLLQKWSQQMSASSPSASSSASFGPLQSCLRSYARGETEKEAVSLAEVTRSAFKSDLLSVRHHLLEQSLNYKVLSKEEVRDGRRHRNKHRHRHRHRDTETQTETDTNTNTKTSRPRQDSLSHLFCSSPLSLSFSVCLNANFPRHRPLPLQLLVSFSTRSLLFAEMFSLPRSSPIGSFCVSLF